MMTNSNSPTDTLPPPTASNRPDSIHSFIGNTSPNHNKTIQPKKLNTCELPKPKWKPRKIKDKTITDDQNQYVHDLVEKYKN